jgi:hypothetical protein
VHPVVTLRQELGDERFAAGARALRRSVSDRRRACGGDACAICELPRDRRERPDDAEVHQGTREAAATTLMYQTDWRRIESRGTPSPAGRPLLPRERSQVDHAKALGGRDQVDLSDLALETVKAPRFDTLGDRGPPPSYGAWTSRLAGIV